MEETTLPGKRCTLLHDLFDYISQLKNRNKLFLHYQSELKIGLIYLKDICLFYQMNISGNDMMI